ncbi:MAG: M28 family metallopeptidase [Promethearchaeota archaeon]
MYSRKGESERVGRQVGEARVEWRDGDVDGAEAPRFDEGRLIADVRKFSFPRRVGSAGEARAKEMVVDEFREIGYEPVEEPFKFSLFFANFWVRGSLAMLSVLMALYVLRDFSGVAALAFHYFLMFLVLYFLVILVVFRDPTNFRPRNVPATNVYAKLPARKKPSGIVVVSAHFDSKSQRLTIKWRAGLAIFATAFSSVAVGLMLVRFVLALTTSVPTGALTWVIRALLVPVVFFFLLLAANTTGNSSPGAVDNATGVACVFELARHFRERPLDNYELWFVQFDAEELGTMGSRFFLRAHGKELKLRRRSGGKYWSSFNVNFDMIDTAVRYIQERKLVRKHVYRRLADAIRSASGELGIELHSWYLGPGASTDRVNFSKHHIEALDVCDWTGARVAHSTRDAPERVQPHLLRQACELVANVIGRIDAKRLEPKHPRWEKVKFWVESQQMAHREHKLERETKKVVDKIDKTLNYQA